MKDKNIIADLPEKALLAVLPLLVTTGEPAGIGMDIVLQLAIAGDLDKLQRPIMVLADAQALNERYEQIYGVQNVDTITNNDTDDNIASKSLSLWPHLPAAPNNLWQVIGTVDEWLTPEFDETDVAVIKNAGKQGRLPFMSKHPPQFFVIHTPTKAPVAAGKLNVDNAAMVMAQLQLAHKLAYSQQVSAIVTGPLQKSVLIEANLTLADGSMFTGHTEFFMQQSGRNKVVMMLANEAMRVALVTIHLPLRDVADAITAGNVRQTVQIVLNDLHEKFGLTHPKVLVCGLNPHAGEDGHLGMEEIEIINPVLREFQALGADISLAMPADTLFTLRHLASCDAVIAMYHDQGLPVLKSHGFGDTVNLTLGLPYIRTSVDHGTALDLAGKPADIHNNTQASASSLWQALIMAADTVDAAAAKAK